MTSGAAPAGHPAVMLDIDGTILGAGGFPRPTGESLLDFVEDPDALTENDRWHYEDSAFAVGVRDWIDKLPAELLWLTVHTPDKSRITPVFDAIPRMRRATRVRVETPAASDPASVGGEPVKLDAVRDHAREHLGGRALACVDDQITGQPGPVTGDSWVAWARRRTDEEAPTLLVRPSTYRLLLPEERDRVDRFLRLVADGDLAAARALCHAELDDLERTSPQHDPPLQPLADPPPT